VEKWRGQRTLNSALSAVTAAVVGVILNLAVWFGQHVLFPEAPRADGFALVVGLIAFVGLWRFKWNIVVVIVGSGVAGLIYRMLF
jgi:chromate transporter